MSRASAASAESMVMPEGFHFPSNHEFWIPLRVDEVKPLEGELRTFCERLEPTEGGTRAERKRRHAADLDALERQLGDMLGIRVKVAHNGAAGTVTLHYNSLDQLDMICQRLSGEPI